MFKKYCQKCRNYSYSSYTEMRWLCPTCGNDLRKNKLLNINEPSLRLITIEKEDIAEIQG